MERLAARALVARLGGDGFALAAPVADAVAARRLADDAVRALAEPVDVQGGRLVVTVSVGLVIVGSPYADPTRLLADADTAMYRAKQLGGDRVEVFDTAMRMAAKARATMESDVRDALSSDGLVVHYQPLLDLHSGDLVGLEALVRLRGEQGPLVPPGDFIDVAERTGLVVPLGRQVLETACAQVAAWRQLFGTPLNVTVNVSGRQAARPDFVTTVEQALEHSGLEASCLGLELTESALLSATPATLAGLQALRALTQQRLSGQRLYGQGYLLGPSAAAEEIERMLGEVWPAARSA